MRNSAANSAFSLGIKKQNQPQPSLRLKNTRLCRAAQLQPAHKGRWVASSMRHRFQRPTQTGIGRPAIGRESPASRRSNVGLNGRKPRTRGTRTRQVTVASLFDLYGFAMQIEQVALRSASGGRSLRDRNFCAGKAHTKMISFYSLLRERTLRGTKRTYSSSSAASTSSI